MATCSNDYVANASRRTIDEKRSSNPRLAIGHAQPENNAMKTIQTFVFAAALGAGAFTRAAEPSAGAREKRDVKTPDDANTGSAAARAGAAGQTAPIPCRSSGSQHRQAPGKTAQ